jgi:endonuclease/exonuclease/phosphatase family metal-dependent hydrolase
MKYILLLIVSFVISFFNFGQSTNELELLSWNVFLRPGILKDNQLGRVDSICAYLNNTGADVLVLQEVFHSKSRKRLINLLSVEYQHHTKVGYTSLLGVSSGVMVFSKHEILEEDHTYFKKAKGSDALAKKGGVSALINYKGEAVQIIGTHLQAGDGDKRNSIRKSQIVRLKKLDNQNSIVTIYAGDFNISQTSAAYKYLLNALACHNGSLVGELKNTANFSDHDLFLTTGEPTWIDFILLLNSKNGDFVSLQIEQPFCLIDHKYERISDHNPIRSKILIPVKK